MRAIRPIDLLASEINEAICKYIKTRIENEKINVKRRKEKKHERNTSSAYRNRYIEMLSKLGHDKRAFHQSMVNQEYHRIGQVSPLSEISTYEIKDKRTRRL